MYKIYLDDVRTPLDKNWVVVRNYDEFVNKLNEFGIENISVISLDHDLGDEAMTEYYTNVKRNKTLNYKNINEKTGMDCCKFMVGKAIDEDKKLPQVYVHSANPIGSENMISYINNFLKINNLQMTCKKNDIPHTLHESHLVPLSERMRKWDKLYNQTKQTDE